MNLHTTDILPTHSFNAFKSLQLLVSLQLASRAQAASVSAPYHTLPPHTLLFLISQPTISLASAARFFLLKPLSLLKGHLQLCLVC